MILAKAALMLVLLMPAAVRADGVYDTHFNHGSCFLRQYGPSHLTEHPEQLVKKIMLAPVPLAEPPGVKIFNLMVNLRGSDDYPSAIAYCKAKGPTMACALEGGAGNFDLTGKDRNALLLKVSKTGLRLTGARNTITLSGTGGDDRAFLMTNVSAAFCN